MPRRKATSAIWSRNLALLLLSFFFLLSPSPPPSSTPLLLLLFLFLLCVCGDREGCTRVCMWFWRPEDNLKCILTNTAYLSRDRVSHWPGAYLLDWLDWFLSPQHWDYKHLPPHPTFFREFRRLNSAPHVRFASTLQAKLSPHIFFFKPYYINIFALTILLPLIYLLYSSVRILPRL